MVHTRIRTRIISTLLSAAMCLSMFPAQAFAATVEDKLQVEAETQSPIAVLGGDAETVEDASEAAEQVQELAAQPRRVSYTPEGAAYTLNFDETTGTILGFTAQEGFDGHLVIPETIEGHKVTSIGYSAFYMSSYDHRNQLLTVDLPETVTALEESAFSSCYNLTAVTGGENISEVGTFAFNNCSKLSTVPSFEQVTSLGERVFCYTALTSFHVPAGLTTVPDSTFDGCEALTEITFENQITAIGDSAFAGTGLTAAAVPEGVTTLGDGAFEDCEELESVTLPSTLTSMGEKAFSGCSALKAVSIPGSLSAIPEQAFFDCASLSSVTLGEGVASIGTRAFGNCTSLTSIHFPATLTSLYGRAFENCGFTSICVPATVEQYYTVDGYGYTFDNCDSLVSAVVGSPVIPTCMFTSCDALKEVELLDSVTGISYAAFQYCYNLKKIIIPESVTQIYDGTLFSAREGFAIYGYPGSAAQTYAEEHGYDFVDLTQQETPVRTLSVTVQSPAGEPVTEGVEVVWYRSGESEVLGTGLTLAGADPDAAYDFTVALSGALAERYETPLRQTIRPEDPAEAAVTLVEKQAEPVCTLTGTVLDEAGGALSGVTVTAVPAEGGEESSAQTGADGTFALTVPAAAHWISFQKDGFYSRSLFAQPDSDSDSLTSVTLYPVRANRIDLSLTRVGAALPGQAAIEEPIFRAEELEFSLRQGERELTFEVQGTSLVLPPELDAARETVTVAAREPGKTSQSSVDVTLDENCLAAAELRLTELGTFRLGELSLPGDSTVLVFDGQGENVGSYPARSDLEGQPMAAGEYALVLLQNTSLLREIPSLSLLEALDLAAGSDYARVDVSIADGAVTQAGDVSVPALDTEKLSYTLPGSALVQVNSSEAAVGSAFLLEVRYTLDSAHGLEAGELRIQLPEGVQPRGAMLVNGAVHPYAQEGGTLVVRDLTDAQAVFYLNCAAVAPGSKAISASLELSNGSVQPLGSAALEVSNASLQAPELVGQRMVTVTGKALPGSTVAVYDNHALAGETRANQAGSWGLTFPLAEEGDYSHHFLQGVIADETLGEFRTEEVLVTYDGRGADAALESVVMYYTDHTGHGSYLTLDYTDSGAVQQAPYYYVLPGRYPDFTFQVSFQGDNSALESVFVVSENRAGDPTYIETAYDEASGTWVGTARFSSMSALPNQIRVLYTLQGEPAAGGLDNEQQMEQAWEVHGAAVQELADAVAGSGVQAEYEVLQEGDGFVSASITYTNPDASGPDGGEGEFNYQYDVRQETVPDNVTREDLLEQGYDEVLDSPEEGVETPTNIYDKFDMTLTEDQSQLVVEYDQYDLNTQQQTTQTYRFDTELTSTISPDGLLTDVLLDRITSFNKVTAMAANVITITGDVIDDWTLRYELAVCMQNLRRANDELRRYIDLNCDNGRSRLPYNDWLLYRQMPDLFEGEIAGYVDGGLARINAAALFTALNYAMGIKVNGLAAILLDHFGGGIVPDSWGMDRFNRAAISSYIGGMYTDIMERILQMTNQVLSSLLECDDTEPDPKPNPEPGEDFAPTFSDMWFALNSSSEYDELFWSLRVLQSHSLGLQGIFDPSGYVYEAVPSNRLENVTATVYYQDTDGEAVEWNAADYDQINPRVTGPSGMYAWFVPEGSWKVTFTKDGYQSADSSGVAAAVGNTENPGWLPVPPPQFNVDVGLVSLSAPEVERAAAYTDRIEVVFSQYMDLDSVQSALSLSRDGRTVDLAVQPLDAEYDLEGTARYATRFAAIPADGTISGDLTVSAAAKNYAGKSLSAAYSQALPAPVQRPAGITADDAAVVLHESADAAVTLQPAIAGERLAVENLTPGLLSISADSIVTGENGTAVLTLTGVLPGTGLVRVTEPDSGLTEDFIVTVVTAAAELPEKPDQPQPEKPAAVTAALADGTPVVSGMMLERGAQVILTTATQGAEIRYTLNDTCPCAEEALTYASPITLTEDTVLRAAALLDGVYSDTIRLELTVQAAEPEDPDDSNDSGSGGGGGGSSSTGGGSTTAPEDEPSQDSMPFIDVDENDWFYDAVAYAYENNLMAGTSGTAFSPDLTTTRAMIVTILYRLEDTPIVSGGSDFTDVEIGQWYSDAIAWAAANNIVGGYGNGLFGPDDTITREQLAAILYRYAQYKGYGTTASADLSHYADLAQLSEWAQEAVAWANSEGIISGTSAVTLAPKDSATRAQAAAMMMRFCENITQ